jgi:hypothetical protein
MIDRLIRELEQGQNSDGGWGYNRGKSWTEPTCFALLALEACGGSGTVRSRTRQWLLANQLRDGGWGPEPSVPISTWVTSLALIALSGKAPGDYVEARAVRWVESQIGIQRMGLDGARKWLLGASSKTSYPQGWSFFPGTASWVMPTALSIVALSKAASFRGDPALADRVADGRRFLLSRRCQDGGWNQGGSFVRGEGAASYPETTGIGLLAFQGSSSTDLERPLAIAGDWLARTGSVEARSWIRIALYAHGRAPAQTVEANPRCWTNYDRSLFLLAEAAQSARNAFATGIA